MKLIIQIPCLNEAEHLPTALAALPRSVPGFDTVEWLVIDDGSTDDTRQVAMACGVDHVIGFPRNRGLAAAFSFGIEESLRRGADVVVNTDADNQYDAASIPALVAPILSGEADLVIGDRETGSVAEFSPIKRALQRAGTSVVRSISGLPVEDATSGFRAYSRAAAMSLVITTPYTYTLESLVQAGNSRLALVNVPVGRNDSVRPSRLFGSMWGYVRRNSIALFRILSYYSPLRFFWTLATVLGLGALAAWAPFALDFVREGRSGATGHMQSIILGAVLAISAVQMFALGVIADQVSSLRQIGIRNLRETRELHYGALHARAGRPTTLPGAWDAPTQGTSAAPPRGTSAAPVPPTPTDAAAAPGEGATRPAPGAAAPGTAAPGAAAPAPARDTPGPAAPAAPGASRRT